MTFGRHASHHPSPGFGRSFQNSSTRVPRSTLSLKTPAVSERSSFPHRSFWVAPPDPFEPGFLGRGPLTHVGENYLAFPDGTFWIKGGTNSPENLFGYAGFDGAVDVGGTPSGQDFLHEYGPHVADWQPGDPDWAANGNPTAGRGIIGALNYLANEGVNAVYFLPNNLGGDGNDTFPFINPGGNYQNNTHWDASRMEQWNVVMEHATRKGILVHLVLAEEESGSVNWLSSVYGVERKLFFRNLVAMFGHNLGVKFNFCEENSAEPGDEFSVDELCMFAKDVSSWDAYDHPLSVHTDADDLDLYLQILGASASESWLTATSLQSHDSYGQQVELARRLSLLNNGTKLVVDLDEQGTPGHGLSDSNIDEKRREILYDVYFSGGNLEWYFGLQQLPLGGDVDLEDFRTREPMWRYMRFARELLAEFPFWRMLPKDELVSGESMSSSYGGAEVFADPGRSYLVYYPQAQDTGAIDLRAVAIDLTGSWFNPRTGLHEGVTYSAAAGNIYDVPSPPHSPDQDWVFILQLQ